MRRDTIDENGRLIIKRRGISAERRKGRLEGVLLTARAAAHEINNPLAEAVGFTELVSMSTPPSEAETLGFINNAHDRIAEVVRNLQRVTRITITQSPEGPMLEIRRSSLPKP